MKEFDGCFAELPQRKLAPKPNGYHLCRYKTGEGILTASFESSILAPVFGFRLVIQDAFYLEGGRWKVLSNLCCIDRRCQLSGLDLKQWLAK